MRRESKGPHLKAGFGAFKNFPVSNAILFNKIEMILSLFGYAKRNNMSLMRMSRRRNGQIRVRISIKNQDSFQKSLGLQD